MWISFLDYNKWVLEDTGRLSTVTISFVILVWGLLFIYDTAEQSSRLISTTGSEPVLSGSPTYLRKQWHFKRTSFCLEAQSKVFCLPASSNIKWILFCSRGRLQDGGRERGRDGWIPLNHHPYQPSSPLWGGCLRALQNKLRVIFLNDADSGEGDNNDFSHVIKGIFTSACGSQRIVFIPPCDKYLIDEQCCQRTMCCAATGLKPTWKDTVKVVKVLWRNFREKARCSCEGSL